MAKLQRQTMFNREWWTTARTLRGAVLSLGMLAGGILAMVAGFDAINTRIIQPDFQKRFELCHKTCKQVDSLRYRQTYLRQMRIESKIDVIISNKMQARADSIFKVDSIRFERYSYIK